MGKLVEVVDVARIGDSFIPEEYLLPHCDEYHFRDIQNGKRSSDYRNLTKAEIEILKLHLNSADDWALVLVSDPFDPFLIKSTSFHGLVRIGKLEHKMLRFHDFMIPQGITNCRIISSDIGDYCAIHDVKYLSHYIIKPYTILHRIGEMQTTNHAKFGIGVIKKGEDEDVRVSISIRNENLGRSVYPFLDMTCGDAYLWSENKDNQILMEKLDEFTKATLDDNRGYYGVVDTMSVIKECSIVKDVNFGPGSYVKGANKLKNLTVLSHLDECTQIGEGVELVNGIIHPGCHIFYGVKAVRFIMMEKSNLKYGARLINSILGENSTVSCCEVLNNLVFPSHEQHHNNSFLISALIKGQSNMAAGANIGSNHNSRAADGELIAGRGFWPALSSTLKYNSYFASFTLIAKGNYPNELNLRLPFCLLLSDVKTDERVVMPAYWWMYNMYALERNSYKVIKRDKRKHPRQIITSSYLAIDTVYEISEAIDYLEAMAMCYCPSEDTFEHLLEEGQFGDYLLVEGIENKKMVKIIKWKKGYKAYREMLLYFAINALLDCDIEITKLQSEKCEIEKVENFGGQLLTKSQVETLIDNIVSGKYTSWEDVHNYYKECDKHFIETSARFAIAVLKKLYKVDYVTREVFENATESARAIREYIEHQIYVTKHKDDENDFRLITYKNELERDIVLGKTEDNPFVLKSREISLSFYKRLDEYKYR